MPDNTLSVAELVGQIKQLNELSFPDIWVEGEVSSVSRPQSGHIYFTLVDPDAPNSAQLRCVLFKNKRFQAVVLPEEGEKCRVRGKVSVYAARCDLQLIASYIEAAGEGNAQRAFEKLKQKLADEGLFDPAHKQAIPAMPRAIGVISSPSGAALQDILRTLNQRFPLAKIKLFPAVVQGDKAPASLLEALQLAEKAHQKTPLDSLILARGGGAAEDLTAFNHEPLARAIHACPIPIISGVGHEIDFSIADFVADLRAATPTAAAVAATPDHSELLETITAAHRQINRKAQNQLETLALKLDHQTRQLRHPREQLSQQRQHVFSLQQRAQQRFSTQLTDNARRLTALQARLQQRTPQAFVQALREKIKRAQMQLRHRVRLQSNHLHSRLAQKNQRLELLNPLNTLERGYAIVYDEHGKAVSSVTQLQARQTITTHLADGQVHSAVTHIKKLRKNSSRP